MIEEEKFTDEKFMLGIKEKSVNNPDDVIRSVLYIT